VAGVLAVAGAAAVAPDAGTALVVSAPLDRPDAILVLASHEWERLPAAEALAARFPEARVLLTLPPTITKYNCHDCANRPATLVQAGVQADRIEVLPISRTVSGGTRGEAEAARVWTRASGARRILVVTSPYHTRRALATFDAVLAPVGVRVGIVPASATSPAQPDRWWSAGYDRAYVRYEWAGLVYYLFRFGIDPRVSAHVS
jgi:uncharacterized SAM-binding protein YcdF (DUF218 family)